MGFELFGWRAVYPRHKWTLILRRRKKDRDAKKHKKAIRIALAVKRNRGG